MSIDRCVIVGAGAVGASLGFRLEKTHGDTVAVAAQGERAQRYASEGLIINGEHWYPQIVDPSSGEYTADLVIIAVKFNQFHEILPMVDRLIGPGTQILSLLNGLASEEILLERYGSEHVFYGLTVGQDTVRIENRLHFVQPGRIIFGEKKNDLSCLSERVQQVKTYLEDANVVVEVPQDMEYQLWWKLMVNTGINQASAVLRAPYREFQQPGEAFDLMKALILEVIELSGHTGCPLSYDDFLRWCELLDTLHPDGKTSMLQDVEAGRPTEVELFSGTIVRKAAEFGMRLPVNESVLEQIRRIDQGV